MHKTQFNHEKIANSIENLTNILQKCQSHERQGETEEWFTLLETKQS